MTTKLAFEVENPPRPYIAGTVFAGITSIRRENPFEPWYITHMTIKGEVRRRLLVIEDMPEYTAIHIPKQYEEDVLLVSRKFEKDVRELASKHAYTKVHAQTAVDHVPPEVAVNHDQDSA